MEDTKKSWINRNPISTAVLVFILILFLITIVKSISRPVVEKQSTKESVSNAVIPVVEKQKTLADSVEIASIKITHDTIGTPQVEISLKNKTTKTIDAVDFTVDLYNNYGQQLGDFNDRQSPKPFGGTVQQTIAPNASYTAKFSLAAYDQTTKLKNPELQRIHFTDGTTLQ